MTYKDAGRLGGLQTWLRAGTTNEERKKEMSRRAKLGGGRPRLPTYEDLVRQQKLIQLKENKLKEEGSPTLLPMAELKRAFKVLQKRSTVSDKNNGEIVLAGN